MRIPSDLTADPSPRRRHRARWWLIGFVVVLVILLVSLRSLAGIYTDSLWFSSVGFHNVFSTLLVIKLGLFGVFGAIFFAVLWVNLVVCDRIAGHDIVLAQEDELVRRYQQYVRPYAGRIYVALAFVLALIGASGTISQWNNWILFRHGGDFHVTDPQFHKDIGFYVFDLPFLTFIVDWTLAILIVTLAVSLVFHYFNGGIQPQRGLPRVRPPVKAHISVLLALIALDKAAGYVLQRWSLVNAQDGYVNGAGYTDVHARLPAETLLIYVSVFAAAILLFNIRRQGWTLPVLAIGIWAFVALVVGIIYPALLQTLKVTPAQSSLEAPYIQRNITATRDAYNLNNVSVHQFPASTTISASQALAATPTISNIRQWDPDPSISLQTFLRLQSIRSYYTFPSLGVDRYTISSQRTPVLVGVREISSGNVPSPSWVNIHLQYTHGNGAAVALANQTNSANPVFAVQGVPPQSSAGLPAITQPSVYFALGESGYVVANSKQTEVDYEQNGTNVQSHYSGSGGVQLSSIFTRAAFALRLGDFNLLISSQITNKSRIMFVRDPVAMAQKAAPFLSFDHDPYAVINDSPGPNRGHIDWVVDGYTTTANYAYSQNADTQQVAIGSNLPPSYNYVRNSVKVVIDAYSGKMTFYDADPSDPILQAYSAAFPHMFVPLSTPTMSTQLQAHLRYPPDIFSIQSAIYGRYHLTNAQNFYAANNAWQLSPTAGAGPQSQALLAENTYNNQGQLVSTTPARMDPQYQVYALPNASPDQQLFTVSDGFVPASQSTLSGSNQNFNLTAWMVGLSDPGHYGQLELYQTPQGATGPANADAEISADPTVSKDISLLDQRGSQVLLGETLMVPIADSMVYLRPLYVAATTNPQPQLAYVVAVLGKNVRIETSLAAVLSDLLQTTVTLPTGSGGVPSSGTVPAAVEGYLTQAQADYTAALAALKADNLATFQSEIQAMDQQITQAQQVLGTPLPGSSSTSSTTQTTAPTIKPGKATLKKGSSTSTSTTPSQTSSTTSSTTTTAPASTGPAGGATTTSSTVASAASAAPAASPG